MQINHQTPDIGAQAPDMPGPGVGTPTVPRIVMVRSVIYGLRSEFAFACDVQFAGELGCLDAPHYLPAGSMVSILDSRGDVACVHQRLALRSGHFS